MARWEIGKYKAFILVPQDFIIWEEILNILNMTPPVKFYLQVAVVYRKILYGITCTINTITLE